MIRIGINGFGRMGRLAFRAIWDRPDVSIVHINEIKGGAATAAHLLEFDSVHGRWTRPTTVAADHFTVDSRKIVFTDKVKPNDVQWEASGDGRFGAVLRTRRPKGGRRCSGKNKGRAQYRDGRE
jgi:glyceraldehyde 3-phosphate dehydrogenase